MKRNYDTDDISPLMKRQMKVMHRICDKYPAVDFYRCCGTRKHGCRVTVLGEDVLEVWADDLKRKPAISQENTGSVCTKYVSFEDKNSAICVGNRNYERMGDQLYEKYAYHPDWSYKWSHWTRNLDELYDIIERIIRVYAEENKIDLMSCNEAFDRERNHYMF